MSGEMMFEIAYAYFIIGVLVALIVPALDGMWDDDPSAWLYVGMAVFWPLVLVAVLFKSAKSVWKWGFGRKEK